MDLVGEKLGQYQIIEELGRGGMAVVYKAYQSSLNRYVAIKVLPPQFTFDEEFVQRFLREARAAAALHHPNIVTIHDISRQNDLHFIVMEFVKGKTLDRVLAEGGRMPIPRIERIVSQVVDALEHAHQRGLIHRDIKPTNIMVDEQQNDQVTLMDFGLVRAATGSGLTKTGVIVGTPEYMSPEQAEGQDVDSRTDIYSLGVVLYKMVTGQVPFSRSTPHAVLIAHITQEPPSLRDISPGIPPAVEAVVQKAMAKDRGERYTHARDLGHALKAAVATEPTVSVDEGRRAKAKPRAEAPPTVVSRKPASGLGGKRWMWGLGAAAALVLLGVCGAVAFASGILPFSATTPATASPTAEAVVATEVESAPATVTLVSTRSPTRAASPTREPSPTPSPPPSATPRSTPSATPSATPTSAATATSEPTATATRVGAATATPTTAPSAAVPQPLAPPEGGTYKNPITFQWSGSLSSGQSYQVTARHQESGQTVQSAPVTAESWTADLPGDRTGEWRWSVAVVQGGQTVATSREAMFWFDPFDGGDGNGDGDGDGGETPTVEPTRD